MDIVEFLTARLATQQAVAERATGSEPTALGISRGKIVVDPTWVLAEVAAKRAVLDLHPNVNDGDCGTCVTGQWGGYPTNGDARPSRWPCETVRLLAQPHADHPDFDPAWKVSE